LLWLLDCEFITEDTSAWYFPLGELSLIILEAVAADASSEAWHFPSNWFKSRLFYSFNFWFCIRSILFCSLIWFSWFSYLFRSSSNLNSIFSRFLCSSSYYPRSFSWATLYFNSLDFVGFMIGYILFPAGEILFLAAELFIGNYTGCCY